MRLETIRHLLKTKQQTAEPEPSSDLGTAIDQLIKQRVAAELERQETARSLRRGRHWPDFDTRPEHTSFEKVPEPPRTAPLKDMSVQVERNELRRIAFVTVGKTRFAVQRDAEGLAVRLVPTDLGIPPTPAIQSPIPEKQ